MANILSLAQIKAALTPVFATYGVRKATLFGSYAKGIAKDHSDVDLLVDSGLKGLRFVQLANDIEDALGKPADVFDVSHVDAGSQVDSEIKNTGVVFYGR